MMKILYIITFLFWTNFVQAQIIVGAQYSISQQQIRDSIASRVRIDSIIQVIRTSGSTSANRVASEYAVREAIQQLQILGLFRGSATTIAALTAITPSNVNDLYSLTVDDGANLAGLYSKTAGGTLQLVKAIPNIGALLTANVIDKNNTVQGTVTGQRLFEAWNKHWQDSSTAIKPQVIHVANAAARIALTGLFKGAEVIQDDDASSWVYDGTTLIKRVGSSGYKPFTISTAYNAGDLIRYQYANNGTSNWIYAEVTTAFTASQADRPTLAEMANLRYISQSKIGAGVAGGILINGQQVTNADKIYESKNNQDFVVANLTNATLYLDLSIRDFDQTTLTSAATLVQDTRSMINAAANTTFTLPTSATKSLEVYNLSGNSQTIVAGAGESIQGYPTGIVTAKQGEVLTFYKETSTVWGVSGKQVTFNNSQYLHLTFNSAGDLGFNWTTVKSKGVNLPTIASDGTITFPAGSGLWDLKYQSQSPHYTSTLASAETEHRINGSVYGITKVASNDIRGQNANDWNYLIDASTSSQTYRAIRIASTGFGNTDARLWISKHNEVLADKDLVTVQQFKLSRYKIFGSNNGNLTITNNTYVPFNLTSFAENERGYTGGQILVNGGGQNARIVAVEAGLVIVSAKYWFSNSTNRVDLVQFNSAGTEIRRWANIMVGLTGVDASQNFNTGVIRVDAGDRFGMQITFANSTFFSADNATQIEISYVPETTSVLGEQTLPKGLAFSNTLGAGVDFNTYTANGIYIGNNVAAATNGPDGFFVYRLNVLRIGNWIRQDYVSAVVADFSQFRRPFTRESYDGGATWTAWR